MPLPPFEKDGNLKEGIYRATVSAIVARFGSGTARRADVTARFLHIFDLAKNTGKLDRLLIFGSYVTNKPEPNDVDVILIMSDDFRLHNYDDLTLAVFDHDRADKELGASVFWVRPSMLFMETMEEFIAAWQNTREKTRRGIIEVQL